MSPMAVLATYTLPRLRVTGGKLGGSRWRNEACSGKSQWRDYAVRVPISATGAVIGRVQLILLPCVMTLERHGVRTSLQLHFNGIPDFFPSRRLPSRIILSIEEPKLPQNGVT